ncbi:MAG TPA: homoserine dehydrogenase [Alphaproteobacteria bacterium]|nr:homoserine dehydrogenase [Alphaproteobacteria bacterium]
MSKPLSIAIAGLGTVGGGTLRLLERHAGLIEQRCGRPIKVAAVSARDRKRDRKLDLSGVAWFDDAVKMAKEAAAEVVVELIGGSEGVAKSVCETAIAAGKHVVTANKALLAHHGTALALAAESKGVSLHFEAAVAGGIPIIKGLREGLAANGISRVTGILNGTCNYILTSMRETGKDFAEVLEEARKLGYAEADPSFDIDGVDTAHKLAILTSVAFGCETNFDAVYVEGIRHVSALDISFAEELGFRIKLLGIARLSERGVEQRVHPCLVPVRSSIAHVEDVNNAVMVKGDFVGNIVFQGRGAGAGPTASAVVADLIDVARGTKIPTFTVPAAKLAKIPAAPMERHRGAYYLRLMVVDQPGVIAAVAAALRDEDISMESMLQHGRAPAGAVPVVITTHETEEAAMNRALKRINDLKAVFEPPRMIRVEPL